MAVMDKISGLMEQNEVMKKGLRKSKWMLMQEWKSFKEASDMTAKCFQQCFNELEAREKHLSLVQESVVKSSQELDLMKESVEQRRKEVEGKMEEFCEVRDREIRDLDCKWKDFILAKQEFHLKERKFTEREEDIALKEKQVEAKFRELEQREKHMEDRFKVLKTFGNAPVKTEPIDNVEVDRVYTDSAAIDLVLKMDGKALQIFLNEHEKKLDSMSDEVFSFLHLSRNPAKLVLDAMEGFYPPHLKIMMGDTEFDGTVARRTCILLLHQLIRVSPKIQPIVRKRALKLANEWKFKMTGNQLEILGFLYLLASYNLAFAFDADELINLLAVVAEHNKSSELCHLLGLKEKIPCFIQNLITQQKHLKAVEFAYAFELADDFPPVPILKDYLKQTTQISDSHCNREMCSVKEKNESIEQSVASIRAVIKCIMDHDLQSQYPPSQLEEYIESLTRQKADVTTSIISEAQKPQQTQLIHMESTSPSVRCMVGHSDAMAVILVRMGGKNLQTFLNNHWKEQELLRIEIYSALKISSDSGMLVLEALDGFYPPEPHILLDLSVIRKSCILLLTQLMILSPKLKPEAKLEARKLAFDWKAKMNAETENHLAILGFVLLVGAYSLASEFDEDELKSLCHTAAEDDNAYQICDVLGIAGEHPQIERSTDPSGCCFIHCVSDPAKVVLDALQKCRSAKSDPLVMKSFSDLLEHLREVSPEITPRVKREAIVLAVEWQETLTGSQLNPSEILGFLQLLATFQLSSSYDSDELLRLLEIVYKSRRAINLFKILRLEDKIPCFIEKLIMKKQWLVAIRFIHAYELVNLFPPVPLLKEYVRHTEELAKKIHDKGLGSREAQEKAINCEISALRAAIKSILCHSLQSEYSPDLLRARIAKLQRQMSDLSIPNQHSGNNRDEGTICAPTSLAVTKKRLASATEGVTVHESRQKQRKLKRVCKLPTRTEVGPDSIIRNPSLSSVVQSSSQPTSADAQSSSHTYDDAKVETREPVLQVQGLCHAAVSVPQSLSPHTHSFYHPEKNLMPKLQELLNKFKNTVSSSGKSEIGPSEKS